MMPDIHSYLAVFGFWGCHGPTLGELDERMRSLDWLFHFPHYFPKKSSFWNWKGMSNGL
jgi:hypothetical protein